MPGMLLPWPKCAARSPYQRRRAFPPKSFQVLPLEHVFSRSFGEIITSGSNLQSHDKELLRDQGSSVFLRQGRGDYGVSRFLGILVSSRLAIAEIS